MTDPTPVDRPDCPLVGINGNAFAIIAAVRRCLRDAGLDDRAAAWVDDAMSSPNYDALLRRAFDYVEPS